MSYNYLFEQAIKLHEAGRLNEAEQIYRQILEVTPENPDVLNLLGLIAQSKNIHTEAISLFAKALRQTPQYAPYLFNLGVSYEAIGKYHEALEAYTKVVQLAPAIKETYFKLGTIYKIMGNQPTAINYYNQALEKDKDYIDALVAKALLSDIPEQTLQSLCQKYNKEPLPKYELSRFYIEHNQYAKALPLAEEIHQAFPNTPQFCYILGQIEEHINEKDKAEQLYRQAIRLNPKYIDALNALAALLSRKSCYQEAEQLFKEVMNLSPQNIAARINYADMLYHAGRLQEAVERYHEALPLAPNSPELSNNFGIILKDLGEYEEALGLFFNALGKYKNNDSVSINIAETLTKLAIQDSQKAQEIAKNWQKSYPNNIFARHFNQDNVDKEYSAKLFDNFAPTYEKTLENIQYNLPQEIQNTIGVPKGLIIDLGCGTGKIAERLKSADNTFIGVDISQKMLDIAQTKGLYKELICADILNWLKVKLPKQTSLIIAADVFCYIKDLSEIIQACAPYPLCFSIEKSSTDKTEFSATGRYQHATSEINHLLTKNGYSKINQKLITLRQEDNKNVDGLIFTAE